MKQLLFCYKQNRKLRVRNTILTDVFVPVEDVISPQKSTLIVPKNDNIELGDIIIIRDNDSNKVEYIGYIDTIMNKTNTEMSCCPLINVFDNDYVLDQIFKEEENQDGKTVNAEIDVVAWLSEQLKRAFIDTDDDLQALPFIIRNHTNQPVFYKKAIDTSNLFEVYTDLFISTGVYVVFKELSYNGYEIDGIYCDIYCNTRENPYYLRYDNPTIYSVDIVDNTFTNYNKIIATEAISDEDLEKEPDRKPKRYYFYLLNNNEITTNPNDERRIKQVRSKEITFSIKINEEEEAKVRNEAKAKFEAEGFTGEELNKKIEEAVLEHRSKPLVLAIYNELQAPEYNLQITIEMLKNDDIRLYKRVDFLAESGIMYSSNITKIEVVKGSHIRFTLGALRNSLTDFKKKVEAI